VERGLAAMPFCSLINHSCNPNVLRHSRPNHIVLYAMYPIRKGEQVLSYILLELFLSFSFYVIILLQILDNYGQHYAVLSKAERQQKLLKQYHFNCDCIPCRENWPLYYGLRSFKVSNMFYKI